MTAILTDIAAAAKTRNGAVPTANGPAGPYLTSIGMAVVGIGASLDIVAANFCGTDKCGPAQLFVDGESMFDYKVDTKGNATVTWQADRAFGLHTLKLVQQGADGKPIEASLPILVTVREELDDDQILVKP